MRAQIETAEIADEAEKVAKIAEIKAEIERFREIVLSAKEVVESEPAMGSKPAKTVEKHKKDFDECMQAWSPQTQMTKTEWAASCRTTLSYFPEKD